MCLKNRKKSTDKTMNEENNNDINELEKKFCEDNSQEVENSRTIAETKQFRKSLDEQLVLLNSAKRKSRSRSLAITKIEEAIFWLGADLNEMFKAGEASLKTPYPESKNPNNAIIEPRQI